ncbi:MAG: Asp-tRNA(Asn)/Glu-tRNA(Gln) amidotransferase subunit GatC [Candidatus Dormibacteria bacterium]
MAVENARDQEAPVFEPAQVAHLSRLARLGLTDEELERLRAQLGDIVRAVGKLAEAPTDQVDPTAQVGGLYNVMREDRVVDGLTQDEALANASSHEAGLIRVPAIQ